MENQHHKKLKITGAIIVILNGLAIANSTYYFLVVADFPVTAWLFVNICAPSVVVFIAGYLSGRKEIMVLSLPFLLFYGGGGLFVFGWSGTSLYAQMGHILMVCASLYIITAVVIERFIKRGIISFAAGAVLFGLIMPLQQNYIKDNPDYLKRLGDPKFEKMISESR